MRINANVNSRTEATIRRLHGLMQSSGEAKDQIVTSVSLVESLSSEFIDALVAESLVDATLFGKKLLEKNSDAFHQSWDRRHEWLNGGFGISLNGSPEWQRLKTVTQVRNAIIHGDGVLTRKQINGVAGAVDMRRKVRDVLGGDIQGRRVILSEDSGRRAILVAIDYGLRLDHAVAQRP